MKKSMTVLSLLALTLLACCFTACMSDVRDLPQEETLAAAIADYDLIWADEFDGDKLDTTKWRAGYDLASPQHIRRAGYYETTEDTLFVRDGALTIRTHYKSDGQYGAGWYTSWVESAIDRGHAAKPENYQGFRATYGYYEIRCIAPPCEGMWSAFWLMPDQGAGMTDQDVPNTGSDGIEIDVMESPHYAFAEKEQNIHVLHGDGYGNGLKSDRSPAYRIPDMYSAYHTYGVLWTETEYVFYTDGRETWRSKHTVDGVTLGVSQVPEYLLMTVEIGGDNENGNLYPGKTRGEDGSWQPFWAGNPDNNDRSRNYDFVIDYVRVYQARG